MKNLDSMIIKAVETSFMVRKNLTISNYI